MTGSPAQTIAALHAIAEGRERPEVLAELIHREGVFHSPVMHGPQCGRELVLQYLAAALALFSQHGFRYVREITGENDAALEFTAEIEGIAVNGVDLLRFDENGRITEFKVMIRPLKAIEKVREKMLAQLAAERTD